MSVPPFLGPYRIGKQIGRGGMGNVYAAEHETTAHQVAVKLISAHVADEPRFRRRFEKEIHALKLLKHPGIVRLIGYGEENGQLFYSMELVDGETLQTRIRREKRLGAHETIDISIQICAALKHAHDIGVQHRDLKPANLMLTQDDQVKLVDFGIPKNYWDSSEDTATGSVLGTPDYMAPEQADDGQITARTDLYSLGSVMYAMLAGRSPFKGKNATAVIDSLRRDQPIPLNRIVNDVPEELCDLVHHLLEKVAGDRPPTALAVANRLKAINQTLQSQATKAGEGPETKAGIDSTGSVKLSGSDAQSVGDGESKQLRQSAKKTIVAIHDKTRPGKLLDGEIIDQDFGSGSEMPTQLSQPNDGDDKDNSSSATRTHFETVDHAKLPTNLFRPSTLEQGSSTRVIVCSFVAIAVVLMILGWATVKVMTPPTADQLYQAVTNGNDIDAAEAFLTRYSDDDRVREVDDFRKRHRLRSTLNRLKATKKIGLKNLGVAEMSFLAAMSDREVMPLQARQKIEQWLAAFGDTAEGDPNHSLAELASYELARMKAANAKPTMDPRSQELLDEIVAAIELDNSSATEKKLRAIVSTFSGESWAEPAIDKAERWLRAREEFPDVD